ncbi:MAG: YitT family protein [Erysipelotrichaceae bacterium]
MKLNKVFFIDLGLVVFAALLSAFGYNFLISEGGLFAGGFSGVCFLISRIGARYDLFNIEFGYINIVLNMIVVLVFYKYCGKRFTILSIVFIACLSLFTLILPVSSLTDDILLLSVFGGIMVGVSSSLTFFARGSSGGTDFIAIYFSRKMNMPIWNYILAANGIVLIIAGFLFGWDKALYSIILQFTVTQVLNQLNKDFRKVKLTIITSNSQVAKELCHHTHHGVTRIEAIGAYSGKEKYILVTVIPARLLRRVVSITKEVDPEVFIDITKVERVYGNYYQPPLN